MTPEGAPAQGGAPVCAARTYTATMQHTVTDADTAIALGSGDVPVLATPRLIAWLEAETVAGADPLLASGQTTVGTEIKIRHVRASAVGGEVSVRCEAPERVGRGLRFVVRAFDDAQRLLAEGEIERVIVDRDRFLAQT